MSSDNAAPGAGETTISVPAGRSRRVCIDVQRYWYHELRGRRLADDGSVEPYPLPRAEQELSQEYRDGSPDDHFVFLAPYPMSHLAIRIDVAMLDRSQFRLTGQSEGFAIYRGGIAAAAQCGGSAGVARSPIAA